MMTFHKQILLAGFFAILLNIKLYAQDEEKSCNCKEKHTFDFALSMGSSQGATSLSWSQLYGFGKKKQRFKLGYGLRFNSYFGNNQNFITAPAKITSRQTGPQVLFSETFEESLDTVVFNKAQANFLNAAIYLQYSITPKLEAGFNIDAIGFSFGGKQSGTLVSSIKPSGLSASQEGKPTTLNLLLISDNDIGSLNSELYLRYWLNDQWAIKGGLTFMFVEYTTTQKLIFDNDRFRNKAAMGMLSVSWKPFVK